MQRYREMQRTHERSDGFGSIGNGFIPILLEKTDRQRMCPRSEFPGIVLIRLGFRFERIQSLWELVGMKGSQTYVELSFEIYFLTIYPMFRIFVEYEFLPNGTPKQRTYWIQKRFLYFFWDFEYQASNEEEAVTIMTSLIKLEKASK